MLKRGENVIGVLLGDGWYCGTLGLSDRQQYGDRPLLLAQLEITLADGSPLRVATDDLWKWQRSQILSRPDVRRKRGRATESRRVDRRLRCRRWSQMYCRCDTRSRWMGLRSAPIRGIDRIEPRRSRRRTGDFGLRRFIYDFGEHRGRVRIKVPHRAAR